MMGMTPLDVIRNSDHVWSSKFLTSLPIANGYEAPPSDGDARKESKEESVTVVSATNLEKDLGERAEKVADHTTPPDKTVQELLSSRLSPLPPVITDERLNLLWPQPMLIRQLSGEPFVYPKQLPLTVSPGKESVHK